MEDSVEPSKHVEVREVVDVEFLIDVFGALIPVLVLIEVFDLFGRQDNFPVAFVPLLLAQGRISQHAREQRSGRPLRRKGELPLSLRRLRAASDRNPFDLGGLEGRPLLIDFDGPLSDP